jgi:UDPglucose 6-dehydrogenase
MNITIVGMGYVGVSNAIILSQKHTVYGLDVSQQKIECINNKDFSFIGENISQYYDTSKLNILALNDKSYAYTHSDYVIICVPTNYNKRNGQIDPSIVESVVEEGLEYNPDLTFVIRSTMPFRGTEKIIKKNNYNKILFMPEFLREGSAIFDSIYPSRIIIGGDAQLALKVGNLFLDVIKKSDVPILYISSSEAEIVKLFSNSFLAMRISFFNEIDTFALENNLSTRNIIEGVCLDNRIGQHYNNPSFGFGGYCLPKDVKETEYILSNLPCSLINNLSNSNEGRIKYITNYIKSKHPKTVGIYRLLAKKGSNNFRESSVMKVMDNLINEKINVIIYEPLLSENTPYDNILCNDLKAFKDISDIIIANRYDDKLSDVKEKLFTRDVFEEN